MVRERITEFHRVEKVTTIAIKDPVWDRLNQRRGRGVSFNEVIQDILDEIDEIDREREEFFKEMGDD